MSSVSRRAPSDLTDGQLCRRFFALEDRLWQLRGDLDEALEEFDTLMSEAFSRWSPIAGEAAEEAWLVERERTRS